MGTIPLPHALFLSFLVLAFASSFTTTATASDDLYAVFHSLPYSPSTAPAPAPFHHHHHHHHVHHHNHSLSPSPAPAPAPIHQHHNHSLSPSPTPAPVHHHNHSLSPSPAYHPSKPPTSLPKPPTHAPVKPPSHSPVKPPSYPPVKPPTKAPAPAPAPHSLPPRKLVAVQGVVYCKNCSYSGVDTLLGASPLSGARVELRCRNTKYMIKKASTTDKNGYFFLEAPKYITTYGAHKCKVFLIKMPNNGGACSHATNLNGGVSGAFLFLNKKMGPSSKPQPFTVFSVGPFAFEPSKCYKH